MACLRGRELSKLRVLTPLVDRVPLKRIASPGSWLLAPGGSLRPRWNRKRSTALSSGGTTRAPRANDATGGCLSSPASIEHVRLRFRIEDEAMDLNGYGLGDNNLGNDVDSAIDNGFEILHDGGVC